MYKFGLAVKELMAVVNEQTRKQTSSVLYTKYSKSISSPLQNWTIEFFFLENRQESMDGHLKLSGIKFYGHQFNTLFPLFPLSLYNIVTQSSRSVFPFFTSKLFFSSTRKKCQTEQTALCHPQKKTRGRENLPVGLNAVMGQQHFAVKIHGQQLVRQRLCIHTRILYVGKREGKKKITRHWRS